MTSSEDASATTDTGPATALPLGPEPKRVLITGGAGYFGGVLARHLADRDIAVTSLDRLHDPEPDSRITYAIADLRYADQIRDVFRTHGPFDAVYHCAALMGHENPDPTELWDSNVTGTGLLADACIEENVPKMVYISSICVFGRAYDTWSPKMSPPARSAITAAPNWPVKKN